MYVLSDSKNHRIMVSLHHELQPEHMPHEGVIQEQFQDNIVKILRYIPGRESLFTHRVSQENQQPLIN